MWFRNLQIYRFPIQPVADELAASLAGFVLCPCGQSSMQSIGWIPPRAAGPLTHVVNNQILLALGVEQRLLPASVVKQFAADWAANIEDTEGRKVGRKEMRELRESAALELMPKAFIRRRTTFGWIDPVNGWLVIDAASPARAEEFLEHLHKSIDHFPTKLVKVARSPSAAMTVWAAHSEAPAGFSLDQDLFLRSAEMAEVRYAKHSLDSDEIFKQIDDGMVAAKLGMTWADRISFVLTENLQIKRLAFLDILKDEADGQAENEDERFDIDFTLMAGEVARLLDDLVASLGGEIASDEASPVIAAANRINDMAIADGTTVTLEHQGQVIAGFGEVDPKYGEAVEIVTKNRRASISLVQRHLRIGYNRAARLIEDMERAGVVSSMDSAGIRQVLVSA